MRITRDELYKQIWSEPATKLAQRYDVSSSYLARVCEGLNVPHPRRGYWARKAVGDEMPIPPLPPADPGDPVEWVKGQAVPERLPHLELPSAKPPKRDMPRPTRHPLVTAWRGFLEEATPTSDGYMLPRKKNMLDAFVTKGMIKSTADFLNALLIELEVRGYRVQLAADYHHHRPAVDVALREIKDEYARRSNDWQPGRATIVYMGEALVGLTVFELLENVRVPRTGSDRYVRIKDLLSTRRYAPQSPDEADLTRDMPTGRLILRAYNPYHDTQWRQEWTEDASGDLLTMTGTIADALEKAAPVIANEIKAAERRAAEEQKRAEERWRLYEEEERERKHLQAQEEARKELRAIVDAWNKSFAVEAFLAELTRHAGTMEGEQREELEERIKLARELMGGQDAIERFLEWGITEDDDQEDDGLEEEVDADDDDGIKTPES